VKEPRYLIRLAENTSTDGDVSLDQELFFVPKFATFVFTNSLFSVKGSDASNVNDEEVDDEVSRYIFSR